MKKLILFYAAIILLASCEKKTINDKIYLRGRLFLTDTVNQNIKDLPLANNTVYLSFYDPENNPNFIQSIKSDAEGYFIFSLDPAHERNYYVYSEYKSNDLLFKNTFHSVDSTNISLILKFDANKQNGFKVTLKDSITNGFLPGISVNIYNSLLVAQLDDTLGTNAFKKITSDNSGIVKAFNLAKGKYYLNARKRFGGTVIQQKLKEVEVNEIGIAYNSMLLK
ncbi:MAG: hypothetical protein J0L69_01165 [Bacteroidetes bacterium]|nr:hypothetical protein [Bacteroidota bacterium]